MAKKFKLKPWMLIVGVVVLYLVIGGVGRKADCVDSDGGKVYDILGTASGGTGDPVTDCCVDNPSGGESTNPCVSSGDYLKEAYCSSYDYPTFEIHVCDCNAGVCGGNGGNGNGCVEDWSCSDWSVCDNGQQTRDCVDFNNCGTTNDKPSETKSCSTLTCQDLGYDDADQGVCLYANNVNYYCPESRNCMTTSNAQTNYICLDVVDDLQVCSGGCDDVTGCTTIVDCTESYEACCLNENECEEYHVDGDPYKCENGEWNLKESCHNDEDCVEETYTYARCKADTYYCYSSTSNKCTLTEGASDCYETRVECEDNIWYYCLTEERDKCIKRYGKCNTGELSHTGTDEDSVRGSCENQINACNRIGDECELLNPNCCVPLECKKIDDKRICTKSCSKDSDCGSGFKCVDGYCKKGSLCDIFSFLPFGSMNCMAGIFLSIFVLMMLMNMMPRD